MLKMSYRHPENNGYWGAGRTVTGPTNRWWILIIFSN
jgi:hypothetical protein